MVKAVFAQATLLSHFGGSVTAKRLLISEK